MKLTTKLISLIIFLLCLHTKNITAQHITKRACVKTKEGKTKFVKIIIPTNMNTNEMILTPLQYRIQYYKKKKLQEFTPEDIQTIHFYTYEKMIQKRFLFTSCLEPSTGNKILLRQLNDGYLKVFLYSWNESDLIGDNENFQKIYLQKGTEKLVLYDYATIKNYLSDCPKVFKKLDKQKISRLELQKLVILYNESCTKKRKKETKEESEPTKYKVDY